ncbi:MAG: hypothetical protein RBT62_01985 [Spirochaetia bacterium]|jgi:hypothetical protein|nr:hypothetical protein [Spirochaetia bacterium]
MNADDVVKIRTILVRLSIAATFATMSGLIVYGTGNLGTLSARALSIASEGAGLAGFVSLMLSISGLLANVLTRMQGAGFSLASLPSIVLSGVIGSTGMIVAGIVRATGSGLSF